MQKALSERFTHWKSILAMPSLVGIVSSIYTILGAEFFGSSKLDFLGASLLGCDRRPNCQQLSFTSELPLARLASQRIARKSMRNW